MIGVLVVDAEAAADIYVAQWIAAAVEFILDAVDPVAKGLEVGHVQYLGAYVEMQAAIVDSRQDERELHHVIKLFKVDTELVLCEAGGDVCVSMGPDVGVYSQADLCNLTS